VKSCFDWCSSALPLVTTLVTIPLACTTRPWVKAVHTKAVGEVMTVESSFAFFKTLALQSSVHRPPYSLGVFSFAEMKEVTEFLLSTYYRQGLTLVNFSAQPEPLLHPPNVSTKSAHVKQKSGRM